MLSYHPSCNTDQGVCEASEGEGGKSKARKEIEKGEDRSRAHSLLQDLLHVFLYAAKFVSQDPKDDELCVTVLKPREISVEEISRPDVQIGDKSCVSERKTYRII